VTIELACGGCGKTEKVAAWDGGLWYLCTECTELAEAWREESARDLRALKEERLASPRYASLRALLTYRPAAEAARAGPAQTDG
jgi:hypothetical protein